MELAQLFFKKEFNHLLSAEKIYKYYVIVNYEFAMQAENILSKVSCQTKLTEYLTWDIVSILKSKKICYLSLWDVDYKLSIK